MSRPFKLTALDKVLLDKRTKDVNKPARSFVGHIKWSRNGKRKVTGRSFHKYRSTKEHKFEILHRRMLKYKPLFRGHLWPHPDHWFAFHHHIVSIWAKTVYYG